MCAPSALPWPRRGLPERPMGAIAAHQPCEAPSQLSPSLPPPPPRGGLGRAHTVPPSQLVCVVAHLPPLALVEGAPLGACSSNAAPPGAPCTTCTRGPCARRTRSAWGVAAPPSSSRPAAPVVAGAAGGRCCLSPVVRHRSAPKHPRPHPAPAAPPWPHVGAKLRAGGGAGAGASSIVPPPLPPPSPARRGWGGGEPGGARDAISARDIAEKTPLSGREAPGSTVQGSAATGGASVSGMEGGWLSCPPGPMSPKPLKLSA